MYENVMQPVVAYIFNREEFVDFFQHTETIVLPTVYIP